MTKHLKLIPLLALILLGFNGCCDKPKVITKIEYIKAKCPKLWIIDTNISTWQPLDINYTIEDDFK